MHNNDKELTLDPITLWLLVLATGWILRSLVEDGVAAARGHPSPRIARHVDRQRLALERLANTGTPPLAMAISTRLVQRINNPPERRAWITLRSYLDDVIADAWEDARTRHEQRRAERMQAKQDPPPAAPPRRGRQADTAQEDDNPILDAEIVEPEPNPEPELFPEPEVPREEAPPPAPPSTNPTPALPAADPTRKDSSVTNTINGDVGSPSEALAFCERTLDLNTACINEIDVALAGLRGAGCGQQFLDIITGGLTAADIFHNAVSGARVRYAKHVLTHADLTSDPDLRNTLQGYLSADKV